MSDAPWWRDGLRFSCVGCGSCCTGEPGVVTFTDAERDAMAEHLGMSAEDFDREYVWRRYGPRSLREKGGYDCVMFDRDARRCTIYSVRPAQCRTFPFWPEVVESKQTWEEYSLSCPGMGKGELRDAAEILGCMRM